MIKRIRQGKANRRAPQGQYLPNLSIGEVVRRELGQAIKGEPLTSPEIVQKAQEARKFVGTALTLLENVGYGADKEGKQLALPAEISRDNPDLVGAIIDFFNRVAGQLPYTSPQQFGTFTYTPRRKPKRYPPFKRHPMLKYTTKRKYKKLSA